MENVLNSEESYSLLDEDELSDIALSGLSYQLSSPDETNSMEKQEPEDPNDLTAKMDDYQEALAHKVQRDSQLSWIYILLSVSVLSSWFLGQMDFSLAWIFLLLLFIGVVWHGNFTRLVVEAVTFEQIRVNRRRALQSEESAEWVNFIINKWWIFSSNSLFTIAKNSLDPLLNDSKPAFLESMELLELTLGDNTPTINRVKAFDVTSGRKLITKSSFDLAQNRRCQLAIELDVSLYCPDYRMLLRARVGGKGVGMDLDIVMEKLNLNGKLNILLSLDIESAFPHITKASFSFIEKPEVWFNLKILKAVQMMEVPVLKTWLHTVVMEALTTALVNPGKLEYNLDVVDSYVPSQESTTNLQAQGVLTVTVSRQQTNNKLLAALNEEERWVVLHLGEQKQVTAKASTTGRWQECRSFLVENIATDKLTLKLKTKRLISTITLAQYDVPLSNFNFESNKVIETVLQKKGPKSLLNTTNLNLRMEYTPLPPIRLDSVPQIAYTDGKVAGVMYVCIHGADDLVAPDKRGALNPYCIIFCNRKKVKTSHYIRLTSSPKWESCVEFLVADYLQMVISFAVCNFDTNKSIDSDLLGIGSIALVPNEPVIVKKKIPLSFNVSSAEDSYGSITVSAVFRPVASVAESDQSQLHSPMFNTSEEDDGELFKMKKNNSTFMQKMFLGGSREHESLDFADILASGSGLMELTIVRARDLVAKDLNGFSDPYCEVKINNDCVFKTTIKKKTLNPEWDEPATLQLPKSGDILSVVVWDRDPLGMKDFLGSVVLTLDDIRQMSIKNSATWFTLKDTKTGEIELRIKVISEDFEIMDSPHTPPAANSFEEPVMKPPLPKTSPGPIRKLPIAVPSPIPPRKGSQLSVNGSQGTSEEGSNIIHTSTPKLENEELHLDGVQSSSTSVTPPPSPAVALELNSSRNDKSPRAEISPTESIGSKKSGMRATPEYSSIRAMKQKVKYGLTHPLRRFRSEASVHDPKAKNLRDRVTVETRDPTMHSTDFDSMVQATSHPDISQLIPTSLEQTKEAAPAKEAKTRYFNIQGRIIQGLGFQASLQNLIYCRVRLHRSFERSSRSSSGKTICKTALVPSSLNPRFDTEFQIDSSSGVSKSAILVFDIRTDKKETIATKTLILREVLEDNSAETQSVQDWFVLSNGAKLEIEISHGKPIDKKSSKLFRSWSVHRIGKI